MKFYLEEKNKEAYQETLKIHIEKPTKFEIPTNTIKYFGQTLQSYTTRVL